MYNLGLVTPHDAGFDLQDQQAIMELKRAVDMGYEVNPFNMQSGITPLRMEVVDKTLKVVTYTEKHFKLFADLPKGKAQSTVEQFIRLTGYTQGSNTNLFVPAGENPPEEMANFQRGIAYVKYLGTMRWITHPTTLVSTYIMDVVAAENLAGTRQIARQLEWALFWGNSKLNVGGTEWLEFDGLYYLVENVYDMKGQPLTEPVVNNIVQVVLDNYGFPNKLYVPPAVYGDILKQFMALQRAFLPAPANATAGPEVVRFFTQAGPIDIESAFFLGLGDLRCPLAQPPATATHLYAPTPPASVTASLSASDDNGDWVKSGPTGLTVSYKVTAVNRYGESSPVAVSEPITLTSTDLRKSITLTITNASSQTQPPVYFNIYRSDNGRKYYWIAAVPAATQNAGGVTTFVDRNEQMPGTYTAFLGELSPEVLEWKELLPLTQVPLAQIQPAIRWLLLMYGVLIMYAPRKWVVIRNIGRLDDSAVVGS